MAETYYPAPCAAGGRAWRRFVGSGDGRNAFRHQAGSKLNGRL